MAGKEMLDDTSDLQTDRISSSVRDVWRIGRIRKRGRRLRRTSRNRAGLGRRRRRRRRSRRRSMRWAYCM